MLLKTIIILMICVLILPFAIAQESTVPDLTGMTVAQAAAALNLEGLNLGARSYVEWDATSGVVPNTILSQSVPVGSSAEPGLLVDVVIPQEANVFLVYDDNDVTFVNHAGVSIDLSTVVFQSTNTDALFYPQEWQPALGNGECGQLWSISRNEPKRMSECDSIQWRTTNNAQKHFWTQLNNVESFDVIVNGVVQVTCPAAPAGTQNVLYCEFFIPGSVDDLVVPYLYMIYTTESFTVFNSSDTDWMATAQTTVFNPDNVPFQIGNPTFFNNSETPIGDVSLLAPGQCLLFTTGEDGVALRSCDVIGRSSGHGEGAFWLVDFNAKSATDGQNYTCPAAKPDKLMLCVIPR